MKTEEAIEQIKKISEYPGTYPCAIVRTPNVIEVIKCIDAPQVTDEQAWNKIAEAYPETTQSLRITLDHAVFGQEAEPQKVKVPAFVAEWFEENKHNLNFAIFELCEVGKAPVDLSEGLTDFEKWFYLNQDIETLVRMVDGYEVEEQLYVMPLPYVELSVHYCIDKDGKVVFRQGNAQKFTEEELDEYFPDIKHFAVKV
ncbi:hypothetical protein IGI39_004015 [Enterococcus sp. AZ135]|uniref:DUF1642 domain-containing protein n=1 Tax=unclassified Enterococcus TaxID=2608891 RepID=UPI003F25C555